MDDNRIGAFKCFLCENSGENGIQFAKRSDLKTHLAAEHVRCFDFRCEMYPDMLLSTKDELKEHYWSMHNKNMYKEIRIRSPRASMQNDLLKKLMPLCEDVSLGKINMSGAMKQWKQLAMKEEKGDDGIKKEIVSAEDNVKEKAPIDFNHVKLEPNDDEGNNAMDDDDDMDHDFEMVFGENASVDSDDDEVSIDSVDPLIDNHGDTVDGEEDEEEDGDEQLEEQSIASTGNVNANISKKSAVKKIACRECNKHIRNDIDSLRQHSAWHMSQPMFNCRSCDYKSHNIRIVNIINHVKAKHGSTDRSLIKDNRKEYIEMRKKAAMQYFGIDICRAKAKKTNDKSNGTVKCSKCEKELRNQLSNLFNHATHHLPSPSYQCKLCNFTSKQYDKRHMKKHVRTVHESTSADDYEDKRKSIANELKAELIVCFDYHTAI